MMTRSLLMAPPARIPTFVVVWLCCRLKGATFVIDWHNLGYSILALSLGPHHPLVQVRPSARPWLHAVGSCCSDKTGLTRTLS